MLVACWHLLQSLIAINWRSNLKQTGKEDITQILKNKNAVILKNKNAVNEIQEACWTILPKSAKFFLGGDGIDDHFCKMQDHKSNIRYCKQAIYLLALSSYQF